MLYRDLVKETQGYWHKDLIVNTVLITYKPLYRSSQGKMTYNHQIHNIK